MGYIYTLIHYLKTQKGRHDFFDYLRAICIMVAVMVLLQSMVGIIGHWLFSLFL